MLVDEMQLSFINTPDRAAQDAAAPTPLSDLAEGQRGVLARMELPETLSHRLMELGFLPGSLITAARSAPGGDPRVFRVDGAEVALRRETARHLLVRACDPVS